MNNATNEINQTIMIIIAFSIVIIILGGLSNNFIIATMGAMSFIISCLIGIAYNSELNNRGIK